MAVFSSAIFWGILLILAGASILLRVVFGIHFPFFKMIFALFLIYLGVRIMLGISFRQPDRERSVVFGKSEFIYDRDNPEMDIVFSQGKIDLQKVNIADETLHSKINVIFSNAEVYIDESVPMKIKVTTVFGGSAFPNETTIAFGDYVYKTASYKEGEKYLHVKADVVFGGLKVINKKE